MQVLGREVEMNSSMARLQESSGYQATVIQYCDDEFLCILHSNIWDYFENQRGKPSKFDCEVTKISNLGD